MTLEDLKAKQTEQFRVRQELTIKFLDTLENFKSETEPEYELTIKDIIHVLSSMIQRAADE